MHLWNKNSKTLKEIRRAYLSGKKEKKITESKMRERGQRKEERHREGRKREEKEGWREGGRE